MVKNLRRQINSSPYSYIVEIADSKGLTSFGQNSLSRIIGKNLILIKQSHYALISLFVAQTREAIDRFYDTCIFQIINKIGDVAYKLDLLVGSCIHVVVHVSKLKIYPPGEGNMIDSIAELQIPLSPLQQWMKGQIISLIFERRNLGLILFFNFLSQKCLHLLDATRDKP